MSECHFNISVITCFPYAYVFHIMWTLTLTFRHRGSSGS
uniref:Uncharacterized protein n=1 Tax=Arundo donax TaxID=35708 RepID=A0A0A9A2L2_ARUDO